MTIKFPGQPPITAGLSNHPRPTSANEDQATKQQRVIDTPTAQDVTVNVTPQARTLNQIGQALTNQPIVDLHRVASIRHDLERGAYNSDPVRVATKLFSFEQALKASA